MRVREAVALDDLEQGRVAGGVEPVVIDLVHAAAQADQEIARRSDGDAASHRSGPRAETGPPTPSVIWPFGMALPAASKRKRSTFRPSRWATKSSLPRNAAQWGLSKLGDVMVPLNDGQSVRIGEARDQARPAAQSPRAHHQQLAGRRERERHRAVEARVHDREVRLRRPRLADVVAEDLVRGRLLAGLARDHEQLARRALPHRDDDVVAAGEAAVRGREAQDVGARRR